MSRRSRSRHTDTHADHVHHDPSLEHHHDGEVPIYDRGLAFDMGTVASRRRMLGLLAGAAAVPLGAVALSSRSAQAAAAAITACDDIPEETAGPFPGDGSNGPNILDDTGVVRRNIRKSFGGATGVADGIPTTMKLRILNESKGCVPFKGAAVYVWQCDRVGRYSMYSDGVEDENYLRGVQRADKDGWLSFKTTFPGCYPGRWPHVHFEVYKKLKKATSYQNKIATSQLAIPRATCEEAYATTGYEQSAVNLGPLSLETDMVFRDGWEQQLATVKGSPTKGYTLTLSLAV